MNNIILSKEVDNEMIEKIITKFINKLNSLKIYKCNNLKLYYIYLWNFMSQNNTSKYYKPIIIKTLIHYFTSCHDIIEKELIILLKKYQYENNITKVDIIPYITNTFESFSDVLNLCNKFYYSLDNEFITYSADNIRRIDIKYNFDDIINIYNIKNNIILLDNNNSTTQENLITKEIETGIQCPICYEVFPYLIKFKGNCKHGCCSKCYLNVIKYKSTNCSVCRAHIELSTDDIILADSEYKDHLNS